MTQVQAVPVAADQQAEPTSPARQAALLIVLLTATFMGTFDFFVVNVAAPSLRHNLHASDAGLELIVGGYAFAYASGLMTGGRLGDAFGHRRLFIIGMIFFAIASLGCGLAMNTGELVAARLAQGIGAATMVPQTLALITTTFGPTERSRAMAWYGVVGGAGSIAGQVLGGFLVTTDIAGLGWRVIFLINVPVGILGVAGALRVLPHHRSDASAHAGLDPAGSLGFAISLGLLLVPLTLGRDLGWPWWTWAGMIASLPVLAVTLRSQSRLRARGGSPILDPTLLAQRSFAAGLLTNMAFMLFFGSYMFTLTLLLQAGLGLDALQSGLAFTPAGLAFAISAMAARRLVARHGPKVIAAGSVLTAVSLIVLAILVAAGGTGTSIGWIVAVTTVLSLGNGIVLPSLIGFSLVDVAPRQAGTAAGALSTAQQFANAAGVAAIGTIFFAVADTRRGAGGVTLAMTWAALCEAVLCLSVGLLVLFASRRSARPSR